MLCANKARLRPAQFRQMVMLGRRTTPAAVAASECSKLTPSVMILKHCSSL